MLCLKKIYRDELLQLAILLSLLRVDPDSYLGYDIPAVGVGIHDLTSGTSWAHAQPIIPRRVFVHPKNLDSILLNYEREVFEDLNALGRYNRIHTHNSDVTAYLLNIDGVTPSSSLESSATVTPVETNSDRQVHPSISGLSSENASPSSSNTAGTSLSEGTIVFPDEGLAEAGDLTQEDMDLIEVLWKQDVDLGFSLDLFNPSKQEGEGKALPVEEDDVEKLKALEALKNETPADPAKNEEETPDDQWAGLSYTIDLETGEYVVKPGGIVDELSPGSSALAEEEPSSLIDLPGFSLEEALQLVGLDEDSTEVKSIKQDPAPQSGSSTATSSVAKDIGVEELKPEPDDLLDNSDEELGILSDMIQTAQFHHPHPRSFQGRMPFVRTMSMEQRWQDLANLLSLPGPGDASAMSHPFAHHHHHHHHNYNGGPSSAYTPDNTRGVLLHNATLAPPIGDLNNTGPYPNMNGTSNLGSAVATSMNLTNSSEPMGDSGHNGAYKMEGPHDIMYPYQNSTSEMNQTTEGFLSSILNDEDLQLMDMAMNEGMYTMRLLDSNNSNNASSVGSIGTALHPSEERMDASSDSAVSSMGSERVPSLSDGEWMETGSDSGHTTGDHYAMDYHASKYRAYDYSYSSRQHATAGVGSSDASHRMPPMAQKKHQMYGKRYFQEQSSDARPALEHIQHNHSYHLPPESAGAMQRPVARDKQKGRKTEEEHLNRDEKRARSMNIPLSVSDIINLPMDEFNERLSKYDLSEAQLSLIRDIRRRGKNKVAAQNCRKRKLDQILTLADEVKEMRDRKNRLLREREFRMTEMQRAKQKFTQLYRHVFQHLRDPEGNLYSPCEYSLQQSADGSVLLVPRTNSSAMMDPELTHQKHKDHDSHHKE
ncbi:segmentation protein cap'n'collar isoform X2 [Periplaneta americana]|uniref:segmentation protein cap'n'collar isoform X2 n=1 Tax=Periplaneta americana TaxID=6978 RepID=UPI0037E79AD1